MASTLRGEALVAVTGITVPLRPGPVRITLKTLRAAEGIPTTIARKMRRFVRQEEPAEAPAEPPWDYQEIMSLLPHAQDEARQVENVAAFQDQDLAMEYAEVLGVALGYVASVAPQENMPAMVGTTVLEPGGMELSEFRRRYQVCDRPLLVLDEMLAGPLMPDQVETLSEVFPGLYGLMKQALFQAMNERGSESASWELPYAKDQILQIFLQTDTLSPGLAAELSKTFEKNRQSESGQAAQQGPTPKSSGTASDRNVSDPSTGSQRIDAK